MVWADSAQILELMQCSSLGTYELAAKAGIAADTLLRVLEGFTPTRIRTIHKIATALGVDHRILIDEEYHRQG